MVLEVEVWGSREWYEQAVPLLTEAGLRDLPKRSWSDPETDGERMLIYFDLDASHKSADALQLADVLKRVRDLVMAGEAPSIAMRFVASR
ncbi:MAG: hypothetical protein EB084_01655 [Proteobacteria bacterium]|nr:hypothetical protein [Pseudomonadota bacterium]